MTDVSNLDNLAAAIATSSAKIRSYAVAQAAATQSQEADFQAKIAALDARLDVLEGDPVPPPPPPPPPPSPPAVVYPTASIHKPIPSNPDVHSNSAAMVARVIGTAGHLIPGQDSSGPIENYNHPTYWATASDPLFTVLARSDEWYGSNWVGSQFRIPQNAKPADGSDRHFASIQPDGTEWFLYSVASTVGGAVLTSLPSGGGTIYAAGIARHSIHGNGLPNPAGSGNATSAGYASLYGVITVEEVTAGAINHALFMAVSDTTGYVYPANGNARQGAGANWPPNGARFFLDMTDAEIDAIPNTANNTGRPWNKILLKAMAKYGMFIGDTSGGAGSMGWGVMLDSTLPEYIATGVDPWRTWAAAQGMTYYAPNDGYVWDYRTVVNFASKLKVLDWTNPANY